MQTHEHTHKSHCSESTNWTCCLLCFRTHKIRHMWMNCFFLKRAPFGTHSQEETERYVYYEIASIQSSRLFTTDIDSLYMSDRVLNTTLGLILFVWPFSLLLYCFHIYFRFLFYLFCTEQMSFLSDRHNIRTNLFAVAHYKETKW